MNSPARSQQREQLARTLAAFEEVFSPSSPTATATPRWKRKLAELEKSPTQEEMAKIREENETETGVMGTTAHARVKAILDGAVSSKLLRTATRQQRKEAWTLKPRPENDAMEKLRRENKKLCFRNAKLQHKLAVAIRENPGTAEDQMDKLRQEYEKEKSLLERKLAVAMDETAKCREEHANETAEFHRRLAFTIDEMAARRQEQATKNADLEHRLAVATEKLADADRKISRLEAIRDRETIETALEEDLEETAPAVGDAGTPNLGDDRNESEEFHGDGEFDNEEEFDDDEDFDDEEIDDDDDDEELDDDDDDEETVNGSIESTTLEDELWDEALARGPSYACRINRTLKKNKANDLHKHILLCQCRVCTRKIPNEAYATYVEKSSEVDDDVHIDANGFMAWDQPWPQILNANQMQRQRNYRNHLRKHGYVTRGWLR